jgi:5-methylcytosine-specific restriction endonuclease McrA
MAECRACGDEFDDRRHGTRGRKRKRCDACIAAGALRPRRQKLPGKVEAQCVGCGELFPRWPSDAARGRTKFCSQECHRRYRKSHVARITKHCSWCRSEFQVIPYRSDAKFCSQQCYGLAKSAEVTPLTAQCQGCGSEFEVKPSQLRRGHGKYCSQRCRYPNPGQGRARYKLVRRLRIAATKSEKIDWRSVFSTYSGKCALCRRSTPKSKRGTTARNAPEIDHIVPIAVGGSDTYDNVQLLCRECNQKKAKSIIGQLRLA